MLDTVKSRQTTRTVVRFVYWKTEILDELGVAEPREQLEIQTLLKRFGYPTDPLEILSQSLDARDGRRPRTRFSDGSFPVMYTSLDSDTAESEVKHWLPSYIGDPYSVRPAYYSELSILLSGSERDLRPRLPDWSMLIHPTDYTFCNQIGREAFDSGTDYLVTWSARNRAQKGVNVPVFQQAALRDARIISHKEFVYDPISARITSQRL